MTDLSTPQKSSGAALQPADPPSRVPWPPMLLVGSALAAIALSYAVPIPWPGLDDTAARAIGLGIGMGGILLAVWAVWTLHQAKTNVMPHRAADRLVTSGPYRRFRNPIYVADVMLLLGAAELTKNIWFVAAGVVFAVLVHRLAVIPEERHLEARFGDEYRDYKSRSRRWL